LTDSPDVGIEIRLCHAADSNPAGKTHYTNALATNQ
jgi:hypothetical protein